MGTTREFLERICQNKVFLVDTLCEEADIILQHVHQDKLITQREYRNLTDVGNREKTIINLLDKLMSKGEETCCKFIELLGQDSLLEAFPKLKDHPIFASGSEQIGHYKITTFPRGTCVIINNVHFTSLKERMGSDEDEKSLDRVFKWLGFKVARYRDQTTAQMRDLLTDLGRKVDGDCFICCVLSHGSMVGVYGTDGGVVSVDELREPFKGDYCQSLAGKPKLFFIQACRGSRNQNLVTIQPDGPVREDTEMEVDGDKCEISIPADSDFLIARSTTDGYYSYRNPAKGSWFIQSLCKQLEKHCPQGTVIHTILLYVNDEVSRQGISSKQMPVHEIAMRKKLVFPVPSTK